METEIIDLIIQGGAVGIAVLLILSLVYIIKKFLCFTKRQEQSFKNTIDNHISGSVETNIELKKTIENFIETQKEMLKFFKNGKK